jgi:uncharacterized protein YbjQ (UPF0145 family)
MLNIDIMEITPDRKFRRLEPIYAMANSLGSAMNRLKESARQTGANAIIEFQSAKTTDLNKIETNIPLDLYICFGWAIKWVE